MKSKLLSILLLLIVSSVNGQDWAPFKTGRKYLYGIDTKLPPFGQIGVSGRLIIPVKLDTLSGSTSLGFVFGAKDTLYKDKSGKWIGGGLFSNSLARSVAGEYKISNITFLSIIKEGTPVVKLYNGANVALTGYAVQKRMGLVLSQPDSLTNIRWVPETGSTTHPLANDSSFILSKQYGLVQFRNFGEWSNFPSDPFTFFYGYFGTNPYTQTIYLEGIPHLHLGIEELDSPKKPQPGDMQQVLTEKHYDFMPHGGPCIRDTGHTFEVYQEICTDTATDGQGDFYATWNWFQGLCDSTFTQPIQVNGPGTFTRGIYHEPENVAMLQNKIGYYGSQSVYGRFFAGQFKAETGIGFRFWISGVIDAPDGLEILTHPWADVAGSASAGYQFWWNSPCSTGTYYPFSMQIQYPSYLKIGTHTEGNLLLISSVADTKSKPSLRISPNPTTNDLWISSPEKIRSLSIVNALGKVMKEGVPGSDGNVQVGDLPAGVYLLRWVGIDGEGGTIRVLKE